MHTVQGYITGRADPPKRFIDKMLKITGMSYEVLFAKEDSHEGA